MTLDNRPRQRLRSCRHRCEGPTFLVCVPSTTRFTAGSANDDTASAGSRSAPDKVVRSVGYALSGAEKDFERR